MKNIILCSLVLTISACSLNNERKISSLTDGKFECSKVAKKNYSERLDCQVQGEKGQKTFHVLQLKGSYPEIAYDHGFLMAKEMQQGVLPEAIAQYYASIGSASPFQQEIFKNLQSCFRKHLHRSVSKEFRSSADQLWHGMNNGLNKQGMKNETSKDDFLFAYYGIEMSNVFTGLDWQMTNKKGDALKTVLANCSIPAIAGALEGAAEVVKNFAQKQFKMGCIGSVIPSNYNTEGALIHSRNLDSHNLEGWNKAPLIALIAEPGYHKYISAATAGLTYSGGISGFNEKGIAVSLHQMDAPHYDPKKWFGKAEIMPFVQQRILREAASIDEAIEVVKGIKHFASWTILVSDSKTDESASIEISANKFAVARRRKAEPMGQGNHFLDPAMAKEYFQPRYGHTLESLSRLNGIEEAMNKSKGEIDLDWVIAKHAGHNDIFEGRQSFGKTAVKAINVMSTFSIPKKNQFWVTLGDFQPAVHGSILGFQVDFEKFTVTPLGVRVDEHLDDSPYWRLSFEQYVNAYIAFDHGKLERSIEYLNAAIALAEEDDFFDSTYHIIRARIFHKMGELEKASLDWEKLWENRQGMIEHKQAIIAMLSVASNPKMNEKIKSERLEFAETTFQKLKAELLTNEPIRGPLIGEIDFNEKLKIVSSLKAGTEPKLQGIGFVLGE